MGNLFKKLPQINLTNFTIGNTLLSPVDFSDDEIRIFYRQIAERVKEIRKEKNVTQLDLALSIGHKSVSTIAKIESGLENKHYNLEQLYKIAKVLEIELADLFYIPVKK